MTRARTQLVLTGAARRRVFGEYQAMQPSRFMDEVPPELVERIEPLFPVSTYQNSYQSSFRPSMYSGRPERVEGRSDFARSNSYGRGDGLRDGAKRRGAGTPGSREADTPYSYENEDQSSLLGLRLGAKVRHPQFGVGTILSVEELTDDVKLVVRF